MCLSCLSAWVITNRKSEITNWIRTNLRLVITVEVLFLIAFAFLAFLRAGNPELDGTERPMDDVSSMPFCARRHFLRMTHGFP